MSTLQDTIVSYLTEPYIYRRAVDPALLIETLHRKYPERSPPELHAAIRRVAAGIGVETKAA